MISFKKISHDDISQMEKVTRLKLINGLSGFKGANLIGTINRNGIENLAVFNSVVHIGSNPPFMGFIMRPLTVARHTYENIKETGWYTINHINKDMYRQAHQTSGNYKRDISEFDISGLHTTHSDTCSAPFVEESRIRIGMKFEEEHPIEANGTMLIVGSVEEVWLSKDYIEGDGYLDIEKAGSVAISGLDGYYEAQRLDKLSYVRVDPSKARRAD